MHCWQTDSELGSDFGSFAVATVWQFQISTKLWGFTYLSTE